MIAVHRRGELAMGTRLRGPAVIEELTATTWIPTDGEAFVGPHGLHISTR